VKFTHINRVIHQNRGANDGGADDTTRRDDNLRLMTAKPMTAERMTRHVVMTPKVMTAERMTLRDGD
jgi:hypothetical protein